MKRPWLPSYNDGAVKCTRLAGWAAMQARTFRERPDSTRGRHLSSYRRTWLNVRFRAAPRGPERPPWARSGRSAARSGTSANDPKRTRRCGLAQTEPYCLLRRLAETVAICHFEPAGVGKTVAPRDLGDRDPCCTAIELGV